MKSNTVEYSLQVSNTIYPSYDRMCANTIRVERKCRIKSNNRAYFTNVQAAGEQPMCVCMFVCVRMFVCAFREKRLISEVGNAYTHSVMTMTLSLKGMDQFGPCINATINSDFVYGADIIYAQNTNTYSYHLLLFSII